MNASEHNYKNAELAQKDRHEAWKQIVGAYNSALTVASGAFVLSISFIQYFDFKESTVWILKLTWFSLLLSVIANVLFRYFDANVEEIRAWKNTPFVDKDPHGRNYKFYKVGIKCFFWITWIGFVVGLLLLFVFAWTNIDNGSSDETPLETSTIINTETGEKWGYVRYFLDLCVLILFTFR